jgi:isopentenyl-diphosphate delta-isomerase
MNKNSVIEEILDIVNENDEIIGTITRSENEKYGYGKKYFIRAVWLFIKNSKGQLWVPRRTATKRIYPLGLDGSAAGHVSSGETYEQTLHREVMEELNIDLSLCVYKKIAQLNPQQHGVGAMMSVYEMISDQIPQYNPEDFCEFFWLYPEEIIARVASGEVVKSDLLPILYATYLRK